jgi:diguanylate cyclase (GGDEF)-like protein
MANNQRPTVVLGFGRHDIEEWFEKTFQEQIAVTGTISGQSGAMEILQKEPPDMLILMREGAGGGIPGADKIAAGFVGVVPSILFIAGELDTTGEEIVTTLKNAGIENILACRLGETIHTDELVLYVRNIIKDITPMVTEVPVTDRIKGEKHKKIKAKSEHAVPVNSFGSGFFNRARDRLVMKPPAAAGNNAAADVSGIPDTESVAGNSPIIGEIDELTGCYQRGIIKSINPKQYVVAFVDLDNFKSVNDVHGHAAGDDVLRVFGKVLLGAVRKHDVVVRYGGDEFILILPLCNIENAQNLIGRIRKRWADSAPSPGGSMVTLSVGLAADGGTLKETLKVADEAMYRVKRGGKNNTAVAAAEGGGEKAAISAEVINFNGNYVSVAGDRAKEICDYVKNVKKNIVLIDAFSGRLAFMLGVDPNMLWKHDWRIGMSSVPAKINKKVDLYTIPMERDEITFQDRDMRALREIIQSSLNSGKKVVLNARDDVFSRLGTVQI